MNRRLACVDVSGLALQILLRDRPEWSGDPVVLLDRDDAHGRILDANPEARQLGLGAGLLYGPCLGLHRSLKGAALPESVRREWQERLLGRLLDFSPHVEACWFQDGTFWLDARGLTGLFGSVKPWLEQINTAIAHIGLTSKASAGSARFSTFAAARIGPGGPVSIFRDEAAEEQWLRRVPVNLIVSDAEVLKTLRRLKLLSVGDVLDLPEPEVGRRLSTRAAKMIRFIRSDRYLPLQDIRPAPLDEWIVELDEPTDRSRDLVILAKRLLDRSLERIAGTGRRIGRLDFRLTGLESEQSTSVQPAHPTRDRDRLGRLVAARMEGLSLDWAVRRLECRAVFVETDAVQPTLFAGDSHRHLREAESVLAAIQTEYGTQAVLRTVLRDDPLPTRAYALRPWSGFPRKRRESAEDPEFRVIRRIAIHPQPQDHPGRLMSRVSFSGHWWSEPYAVEMAYSRDSGGWNWMQRRDGGEWELLGWLD